MAASVLESDQASEILDVASSPLMIPTAYDCKTETTSEHIQLRGPRATLRRCMLSSIWLRQRWNNRQRSIINETH
ncbi:hypothetical protein N7540_013114 [Penicillium herquei]|nr:hypothetical protein N7540_013114 [Penicillium herquei]